MGRHTLGAPAASSQGGLGGHASQDVVKGLAAQTKSTGSRQLSRAHCCSVGLHAAVDGGVDLNGDPQEGDEGV